jgi:hypothetical protein
MPVGDGSACKWNVGPYDTQKIISRNVMEGKGTGKEITVASYFTL